MLTGYPSIDKPWLKYYSEEAINEPLPESSIYEIIFERNQDNLNRVAIDYYGKKITYKGLFNYIDSVACSLVKLGVKQGDIVSICMLNSPETIYLVYALNKIGAVANLISGLDSDREIIEHIGNATSPVLFTLDIFSERILSIIDKTDLKHVIISNLTQSMPMITRFVARNLKKMKPKQVPLDNRCMSWEEFISAKATLVAKKGNPDDAAIICYTGGTTGGSKGVVLSNKSIIAVGQQYIWRGIKLDRDSLWVEILPLFIAYGVTCSLQIPLMVGMTLLLRIVGSASIGELCKEKPQYIIYSPVFWEQFADEGKDIDLSFLVEGISGGDKLSETVEKKINDYFCAHGAKSPVLNGYGMSEVGAAVSVNFDGAYELGSVGLPFVKTIISAFDIETGEELPIGTEGELCIHGPSMMTEYINNPEETANVIRRHADGKAWVHSGDLGYISENGFVHISGRLKRYILTKHDGLYKKVFSLDIERVLLKHAVVNNCAVVPFQTGNDEEQSPCAFIILKKGVSETNQLRSEIIDYCSKNLDYIYQPKKIVFVQQFPLTKVGKVDYLELEKTANNKF